MIADPIAYDLRRARQRLEQATATCVQRTAERDAARGLISRLSVDADLGAGVRLLIEELERLRRRPCHTMAFGVDPCSVADAVISEVEETRAEAPTRPQAQAEAVQVLAAALHLTLAHGCDLATGIHAEAARLRARNDVVYAGGTWAQAKIAEAGS